MSEYTVTKWESHMKEEVPPHSLPYIISQQLSKICTILDNIQALSHPRIASFYAYNLSDTTFTMFRLFVPSGTVGDLLKRGPLSEAKALKYCRQALEALQYLHEKQMVHGNVKCGLFTSREVSTGFLRFSI